MFMLKNYSVSDNINYNMSRQSPTRVVFIIKYYPVRVISG